MKLNYLALLFACLLAGCMGPIEESTSTPSINTTVPDTSNPPPGNPPPASSEIIEPYKDEEISCEVVQLPVLGSDGKSISDKPQYAVKTKRGYTNIDFNCPEADLKCIQKDHTFTIECKGHPPIRDYQCYVRDFFNSDEYKPVKRELVNNINYDNPKPDDIVITENRLDEAFSKFIDHHKCTTMIGNITYKSENVPKNSRENEQYEKIKANLEKQGQKAPSKEAFFDYNKDGKLTDVTQYKALFSLSVIDGELNITGLKDKPTIFGSPYLKLVKSLNISSGYVNRLYFPHLYVLESLVIADMPNLFSVGISWLGRSTHSVTFSSLDNVFSLDPMADHLFSGLIGTFKKTFFEISLMGMSFPLVSSLIDWPCSKQMAITIEDCPKYPYMRAYRLCKLSSECGEERDFVCHLGHLSNMY